MAPEAREELQLAFDELREAVFPLDRLVSDELSLLHAELAEYDGYVAGIAMSLLGSARVDAHVPASNERLRERFEQAAREYSGSGLADAEAYFAYYRRLDRVLSAARSLSGFGSSR